MKVNSRQLLDDGFVILQQVIPPERLEELRAGFEVLVEGQKAIWADEAGPDDPPGGSWETHPQPRLVFNNLVDAETAHTVEFCLHENTLGISRQLMEAPEAAITSMFFMCNPVRDHGPAQYKNKPPNFFSWHRDIDPTREAPLCGLQMDMLENGPGTVQWNIPLYDDDVLWVVPGSHCRPNTEAENRQLIENPREPLPGGIPVELKAGDGVVYINTILHWGSNYSPRLRRTIHLGYRSFGGSIYPYCNHNFYWDPGFTKHLSPEARAAFERFAELHALEAEVIVSAFRAMLDKDAPAFRAFLAKLHPGEKGRMVCVVMLSRLKQPDVTGRFSAAEAAILSQRFAPLDARLRAETEQYIPGFQSGPEPIPYVFEEMPQDFELEDFIASWDA